MKKNLFLLFSLYFFVVQCIIIGLLRGENKFIILGVINLIGIAIVGFGYKLFDKVEETEIKANNEPKRNEFVEHKHNPIHNNKRSLSNKSRNFILSLVIAFIIYLQSFESTQTYTIIFISILIGFIIFLLLNAIFKSHINKTKKQGRMSIVYLFLLAISAGLRIFGFFSQNKDSDNNINKNDNIVASGEVLESGMNIIDSLINSGSASTGTITETNIVEKTQTGTQPTITPTPTVNPTASESLKIIDAIKYLFDKYGTTLSTKTDVSFTYVSKDSPIYPIYRTAYEKKMIGKSTNPTKFILCDSYIVMKGLMGKWNVSYNATNVTTQFRNEAVARGALNGCQKGKTVKEANL